MRRSIYRWGDLFCGAGGNATGVINALDTRGIRHEGRAAAMMAADLEAA